MLGYCLCGGGGHLTPVMGGVMVIWTLALVTCSHVSGLMDMDESTCHEVEEEECGVCHTVYMQECDMVMVPEMMPTKVQMCKNVTRYEDKCVMKMCKNVTRYE